MFQAPVRKTGLRAGFRMLAVTFHVAVQQIRKSHRLAFVGLFVNIAQMLVFIGIMYFVMYLMGNSGMRLRGDKFVFIMSGVMMFITHVKTMAAVSGAEGPTSAMTKHSPMNTIVAISGSALSTLYEQVFAVGFLLFAYHCIFAPVTIDKPVGMAMMMLLSWIYGIAVGLIIRSVLPWAPGFFGYVETAYKRMNVIASGKILVANATPPAILAYFDWNPLFHIIDQGRGFIFLNYYPNFSSIAYAVKVMIVCFVVGLILEYYTRKYASASWGARG